jgi:hypothetical protein
MYTESADKGQPVRHPTYREGVRLLEIFEVLLLMIAFASLILALRDKKEK